MYYTIEDRLTQDRCQTSSQHTTHGMHDTDTQIEMREINKHDPRIMIGAPLNTSPLVSPDVLHSFKGTDGRQPMTEGAYGHITSEQHTSSRSAGACDMARGRLQWV